MESDADVWVSQPGTGRREPPQQDERHPGKPPANSTLRGAGASIGVLWQGILCHGTRPFGDGIYGDLLVHLLVPAGTYCPNSFCDK